MLAASLGIDLAELRGLSPAAATTALGRLSELVQRLASQAATDELTGALRRGAGYAAARAEIERARRSGTPLTLVIVDVDRLKHVNDSAGHLAGDRLLRQVSERLSAGMRGYDVLIRFGGDEFVAVIGGVPRATARRRISAVRSRLTREGISVSVGLAELRPVDSLDDLIARADADLYGARLRRSGTPLAPAGDGSGPGGA
ncbi:MAG TPA: GGDEF domain-containing protein [Candidatus Binatia bacterium]|nr:GGDEF domain-containing protein [Candidatus Binatia bacterium]